MRPTQKERRGLLVLGLLEESLIYRCIVLTVVDIATHLLYQPCIISPWFAVPILTPLMKIISSSAALAAARIVASTTTATAQGVRARLGT